MSIKINTSFLFKHRKSSQKPNKENLSNNGGAVKKKFLINEEDDLPSTSLKSLKQDELKGKKRKRSYEDSDNTSSDENSSLESEFDDEKDTPKQINGSPLIENEGLRQRQENIKARDAFLASFMNDPKFAEAVEHVGIFKKKGKSPSKRKSIKRTKSDRNFHTSCQIPLEPRKSLRQQSKNPQFSYKDLPDKSTFTSRKRKDYDSDDDLNHLEDIVYKPKTKRKSTQRYSVNTSFLPVEDVTDSMINNICKRVAEKVYCINTGTSCHQCRQKTTDTKTFCRAQGCGGVRGQFCGVCLLNRYGEDAALALKDPNWTCPPCRGICNCSFCRTKEGKRPTGVLVPMAIRSGHKSVKDFLDSLNGRGDYVDPCQDPKNLLGFTKDLQYAQMGGGRKDFIGTSDNLTKFEETIEPLKNKSFENNEENESGGDYTDSTQDDPEVLIGFTKDLNYAIMGNNRVSYIGSHTLSYEH